MYIAGIVVVFGAIILYTNANRPENHIVMDKTLYYPRRMYNDGSMRLNTGIGPVGNQFIASNEDDGGYLGIKNSYHTMPNGTKVRLYGEDHTNMYNNF
jgi:hypothetical protein